MDATAEPTGMCLRRSYEAKLSRATDHVALYRNVPAAIDCGSYPKLALRQGGTNLIPQIIRRRQNGITRHIGGMRIIQGVMQTAAFLALLSRANNQVGHHG